MLTVGNDAASVERMLGEGGLACPRCGGRLARWGWPLLLAVSPWEIAAAVTNATLLSPAVTAGGFNASSL